MDSHASSGYLLNHATLSSVYYQGKEESGLIDLGLSLRALQPEAYHPSGHDDFGELLDWNQLQPQLKRPNLGAVDEAEGGVQSKERWAYVKVNMEGVVVGRKICMLNHSNYSSLAFQLEDMFGRQSESGLRLFQSGSEYCLFYKDRDEQWRTAGDVPWKEFVNGVKRLRIIRRSEIIYPSSSSTFS